MSREGLKLKMERARAGAESKQPAERASRPDAKGGDDVPDAKSEGKSEAK